MSRDSGPSRRRSIRTAKSHVCGPAGGGVDAAAPLASRVTWRAGPEFHTVLEVIATQLALTTGAIALVRYYAKRSRTFLVIGAGFLGAGSLDAYHALITCSFMAGHTPSALSALTHWSGAVSRVYFSALLVVSLVWRKRPVGGRAAERLVYVGVGAWCLVSFLFFLLVPLRPAYDPNLFVHRPAEVVLALCFTLAAVGYFRKGYWRFDAAMPGEASRKIRVGNMNSRINSIGNIL